jgi:hypothetical protein
MNRIKYKKYQIVLLMIVLFMDICLKNHKV